MTKERKAKILGLNAARVYGLESAEVAAAVSRDSVAEARYAYAEDPSPSYQTYGPRSRPELLRLIRSRGGLPT